MRSPEEERRRRGRRTTSLNPKTKTENNPNVWGMRRYEQHEVYLTKNWVELSESEQDQAK